MCDQKKVGVAIITSYNNDIIMTGDGLEAVVFTTQGDKTGKVLCYRVNQCICAEIRITFLVTTVHGYGPTLIAVRNERHEVFHG